MGKRGSIRGYQLWLNGEGVRCRPGDIRHFLLAAVDATGLHLIDTPGKANPTVNEAHGMGMALIAESHIFVQVRGAQAVVVCFSCRPFRWAAILRVARDTFGGQWKSTYACERSVPLRGSTSGWCEDQGARQSWWRRWLRWWCGPP